MHAAQCQSRPHRDRWGPGGTTQAPPQPPWGQRPGAWQCRGPPVTESAALGPERRADAGGQGARRGALRGAAHGQALRGQGAGGGGADGRELQGERRVSAVPADTGGRRAWGPWDTLSAGHRSLCERLQTRRCCLAHRRHGWRCPQGLTACPPRGHEARTWGPGRGRMLCRIRWQGWWLDPLAPQGQRVGTHFSELRA